MKTAQEFETEVTAAIAKVQADGWEIVRGTFWMPGEKKCCPLMAMALARGGSPEEADPIYPIELDYGLSNITKFWSYFDSLQEDLVSDHPFALLGIALRRELNPASA